MYTDNDSALSEKAEYDRSVIYWQEKLSCLKTTTLAVMQRCIPTSSCVNAAIDNIILLRLSKDQKFLSREMARDISRLDDDVCNNLKYHCFIPSILSLAIKEVSNYVIE